MNKKILVEYARSVALEEQKLTQDLAAKLVKFDKGTIKQMLELRIEKLESTSADELFSEEFRKSQAKSVREVLQNLDQILV